MSGATFASLLHKSKFATHDPLVTRIYTAPKAALAKGDWGLKYTLPAPTPSQPRSRYIRLRSVDAGLGLGCDHVSGEKEARLMETWGDGRYGWAPIDGDDSGNFGLERFRSYKKGGDRTNGKKSYDVSQLMAPQRKTGQEEADARLYLADVEGMSEEGFEKHLEDIRQARESFKQFVADAPAQDSLDTPAFSLFSKRRSASYAAQAGPKFVAEDQVSLKGGARASSIAPQPHRLSGLAYSNGSHVDSQTHPLLSVPGRVLNGVNQSSARLDRAEMLANQALRQNNRRNSTREDPAGETVVGLGGLTARMRKIDSDGLTPMDPSGFEPESRSTSVFRIADVPRLQSAPRVVASLPSSDLSPIARNDHSIQYISPIIGEVAKQHPLSNLRLNIRVNATGQADQNRLAQNEGDILMGQKGWVGAQDKSQIGPLDIEINRANQARAKKDKGSYADIRAKLAAKNKQQSGALENIQAILASMEGKTR